MRINNSTLKIDSNVPFGDCIYWQLRMDEQQAFAALLRESHQYDQSYLAWETVRRRRNPYFESGTGFEGYFVGICRSPDETLGHILAISRGMLMSISRLYRFEYKFRSRLRKTLLGEISDPKAIAEWATQLGAAVARLRCNLLRNREGDAFRMETYQLVSRLPPIDYREVDHNIRQVYKIDDHRIPATPKIVVNALLLPSTDQDAWLVAQSIGKFGHPLIREFVRYGVY